MSVVDEVVRAILKLALCAVLAVVLGGVVLFQLTNGNQANIQPGYIGLSIAAAVAGFFAMAFYAFRKRGGQ
jgi:high-affinity Fe2+/Pb2+ permease